MTEIQVPVKELHGLILRENIASATLGNEKYDISLSGGCIIFETPKGNYVVLFRDLLEQIIKMKEE